jgi:hypothetical protein
MICAQRQGTDTEEVDDTIKQEIQIASKSTALIPTPGQHSVRSVDNRGDLKQDASPDETAGLPIANSTAALIPKISERTVS